MERGRHGGGEKGRMKTEAWRGREGQDGEREGWWGREGQDGERVGGRLWR